MLRWPYLAAIACGFVAGIGIVAVLGNGLQVEPTEPGRSSPFEAFTRPAFIPHPPDNPPTPEKFALGERLFHDPRLSANGKLSCASCHDPRLAFTDGEPTGRGVTGRQLKRHTPTLWNLAWSPTLMWDGRAATLEQQAKGPIELPNEMGEQLATVVQRLAPEIDYQRQFTAAFPADPRVTSDNLLKAIAAYERTLVSPPTRFDQWIAGDKDALTDEEKTGFDLFMGRGRCVTCHSGFAFTDHSFHDIGLETDDLGRGPVLGVPQINYAFKTPGLRELAWTAPYMHNGSLATLEDVIRHYESGGIPRPTRSKDIPGSLSLSDDERASLVAFLGTLSSETAPKPSREPWVVATGAQPPRSVETAIAEPVTTISQRDKQFHPGHISIAASQPLTILNDDIRTHNVRIYDPRFDFNSGAQDPGESVTLTLPLSGTYDAFCGIHPTMRLRIEVK